MRAVTIAAAGAAVLTTVSATSHVKHMHAKLHEHVARDTWVDWNTTGPSASEAPVDGKTTKAATTTKETPVKPATSSPAASTTSSSFLWEDWSSSSSKPADPASTSSVTTSSFDWADWEASKTGTTTSSKPVKADTTSSKPVKADTTSTKPAEAATTSSSSSFDWADWEASKSSTTSTPVGPATTSTETGSTFDWADWEASKTASVATPVDPAITATETWGDWDSTIPINSVTAVTEKVGSVPVNPAATSSETTTWGDWTAVEETTTITLASTLTTTKYVEPVSTESVAWADQESTSSASVAAASTSSATPALLAEAHSCIVSIITSYGAPTWYPTPIVATNTTTASAITSTSSMVWGDWTSLTTSSTPAVAVSSSSSTSTWADWTASASDSATVTATTEGWAWTATDGWDSGSTASASVSGGSGSSQGGSWGSGSESGNGGSGSGSQNGNGGSSSGSSGAGGIHANGDSWGLTYSPYTSQGGCKDAGSVAADLAVIAQKGFSTVRVYSTDCGTLENIGKAARDNGLKLILGVWVSSSGISGAQGQVWDIINWGQWDLVQLIVVGNEAVFNGYASAGELAGFIGSSAQAFKKAGYTGAVTTTEPLSVWEDSSSASAFCSVVDVVGANLYAFFNAAVTADKAGGFIQAQINILNGVCSGKPVFVLESGWPHAGNCNGAACPSPENQATALKGIQSTVGAQVVFLSYEDEPWKEPGQFGVEQFWGCSGVF
ncbi:murein transglycosylase [Cladophialophora yegresii CBS 114405]|uniref:Probable beta-glucosidase btgE n=1 Tax=Cladophialophora yegresii CBS 114405 TaxID=1182544 RepID=W9VZ87_9EURO|nr:murein transglycosylase [Cladophialophora yegresii CBS 114405]EXJ60978.1 murein transglycosylase [Cladophialophora yegresii CBS 114405]